MLLRAIGFTATIVTLSVTGANAQNFQGMSEAQMQQMMQQAGKMQQCMQDIDQQEVEALVARGQDMEKEVKGLCQAGKRDEAMKQAIAFAKEIGASDVMQDVKRCGEMMKQFMPEIPMANQADKQEGEPGFVHVCDTL